MSKLSRMFTHTHEHTHTPTTTINNYSIIIEITTQNVQNLSSIIHYDSCLFVIKNNCFKFKVQMGETYFWWTCENHNQL